MIQWFIHPPSCVGVLPMHQIYPNCKCCKTKRFAIWTKLLDIIALIIIILINEFSKFRIYMNWRLQNSCMLTFTTIYLDVLVHSLSKPDFYIHIILVIRIREIIMFQILEQTAGKDPFNFLVQKFGTAYQMKFEMFQSRVSNLKWKVFSSQDFNIKLLFFTFTSQSF